MTPCVGCGYDLRGLDADGVCPECGVPLARSLGGDRLAIADPCWLARLVRGQRLLSLGLNLTLVSLLLVPLVIIAVDAITPDRLWIIALVPLGGAVLATVGCVLVTSPDPRDTYREDALSDRLRARVGMVATVAIVLISIGVERAGAPIVGEGLAFTAYATFVVGLVSVLRWLRGIAVRVPDPNLARTTSDLSVRMGWVLALLAVMAIGARVTPAAGWASVTATVYGALLETVVGCGGLIINVLLLVQVVTLAVTMSKLSRALKRVQREVES